MRITEIRGSEIVFKESNRFFVLTQEHEQDCCEEVYADFEVLKSYNISPKTGKEIRIYCIDFPEKLDALIEKVEGMGFNLKSRKGEKFFVPCYNIQNGYYNDDLELILYECMPKETMDISDTTKYEYK